jgi:probable phosphoglycerate mutase
MDTLLTLIRHGETEWNVLGRYQGHAPIPLNEVGRVQAACLASVIAQEASGNPVAALYSSDLARCRQTAEPIAASLGLEMRPGSRWRELHYGAWQGLMRAEFQALDAEHYARYQADPYNVAAPGGESRRMLAVRVLAALEAVLARHRGAHVVVVTHGGPVREVLRYFDLLPGGIPAGNTSRTVLRVEGSGRRAEPVLIMDTSHLPLELRSGQNGTAFIRGNDQ